MSQTPSPSPADQVEELIAAARAGSAEALGRLWQLCRQYLLHIANAEIDPGLNAKAGASDLVQETFLEAQAIFERFAGESRADLLAWLRAILTNKVATFTRHYQGTAKRQVAREVSFDAGGGPGDRHVAPQASPSEALMRSERAEAVLRAMNRLPEHYRQVIVWRQWEDLSFEEIARRVDKRVDAARMIWWRAIERLQQELQGSVG